MPIETSYLRLKVSYGGDRLKIIIAVFIFSGINQLQASPIPMTSSSQVLSAEVGLFVSKHGFQISSANTSWIHTLPSRDDTRVETKYTSPQTVYGVQPALTVRVNRTGSSTVKSYVKRWISDYPKFGFKILKTKPIKVNRQLGFVVDLLSKNNNRQIRQYIFHKKKRAVILTCRSHKRNFKNIVSNCNKIALNFQWQSKN